MGVINNAIDALKTFVEAMKSENDGELLDDTQINELEATLMAQQGTDKANRFMRSYELNRGKEPEAEKDYVNHSRGNKTEGNVEKEMAD